MSGWFLESLVEGRKRLRVPIDPLPFFIGRRLGLDLTLPSDSVSKEHAEIYENAGRLRVRDLDSTNGTFVEHRRVKDAPLTVGNVLHFADFEFRIGRRESKNVETAEGEERSTVRLGRGAKLPTEFEGVRELEELLRDGTVSPCFEPVVTLNGRSVAGYEVSGWGRHAGLPESAEELLQIASSVGLEAELARVVRRKALERVGQRQDLGTIFVNFHPTELDEARLVRSLKELRSLAPNLDLVVQIHGAAFENPRSMAELRATLYELHIGLAYDDFSTTPTRLVELAELPPDYIKFDARLVRGIDRATLSKRRLLTSLVSTAHDLMVRTIADGVSTPGEAETCQQIGFQLAQGAFFGSPVELDSFTH